MDGVNLLPYFRGEIDGPPHETLYWRFWRVAVARQDEWKLLRVAENPLTETRQLLAPLMLINLKQDPAETTNLAEVYPEKTQELLDKLANWEKTLSQPRWYDGANWKHWQQEQLKNHQMAP
jgi:arylsulfatase A-like enzyme